MLNQIAAIHGVGTPPVAPTSYESIATVLVGSGGQSTITFSSIPSTFKHLEIRSFAKNSESASYGEPIIASFNGDTTFTNYRYHFLYGGGSSASAGQVQTAGWTGAVVGSSCGNTPTSVFGASVGTILDYANTNKNKVVRALGGHDMNGTSGEITFSSGLWLNTAAITSITLTVIGGFNFQQHSQIALYGIKG